MGVSRQLEPNLYSSVVILYSKYSKSQFNRVEDSDPGLIGSILYPDLRIHLVFDNSNWLKNCLVVTKILPHTRLKKQVFYEHLDLFVCLNILGAGSIQKALTLMLTPLMVTSEQRGEFTNVSELNTFIFIISGCIQ